MTSLTKHNGTMKNGHPEVIVPELAPDTVPAGRTPTLGELRIEAERLISALGRPVRRVSLRAGDNTVEVDWEVHGREGVAPVTGPDPVVDRKEAAGSVESTAHRVSAPLVGTVYLAPEPGAAPFVSEGDVVTAGQQVAIIEAMKLMNPIVADQDGTVTRVLAKDGEMAEFGEPLFEISPADDQSGG